MADINPTTAPKPQPAQTPAAAKPQVVTSSVAKSQESVKPILVQAGDKALDLIALDSQGKELLFDGRHDFVVLTDDEVRQLGPENKRRYSMARQQNEVWRSSEAEKVSAQFSSVQYSGRAWDKLNAFEGADPKMHYRWTDPKKVGERLKMGYTIASAGDIRSFLGQTNGHHEIGSNGNTELVLMKIPKALYEQRQLAKAQKNQRLAAAAPDAFDQEARMAGVRTVQDSAQDGRDWKPLEPS